jgi:hypothetical protein
VRSRADLSSQPARQQSREPPSPHFRHLMAI